MTTHYLVYKITNKIDGKFYIGTHKTKNLDDGYMGSGKYLKHAIEKYGVENFIKEVLFDFSTPEEMFAKEAELVNEDFLATENTYNLRVGGFGGWDYVNSEKFDNPTHTSEHYFKIGRKKRLHACAKGNKTLRKKYSKEIQSEWYARGGKSSFLGRKHTEVTKAKMRKAALMRNL